MKIKIDREKCIGCGTCPALCPEVFELDENFKVRIKDGADLTSPNIKMASESCPVEAIEAEE